MEKNKAIKKISRFGLFLEISSLIVLIIYWLYLNSVYETLPEYIPIHFNSAGKADGFGVKSDLYELPKVSTVLYAILSGINALIYFFRNLLFPPLLESEYLSKKLFYTLKIFKLIVLAIFFSITLFILQKI